ncbi:hypothetical protein IHE44_0003507 [Lamprotornis superbus]|uniref:BPTI/Kunitz inhibitor domain-containing protein n=1 Tax=Lamprotornis superbus TaxID=245042 RepID=A0A835NXZ4_9PASS|nr:hypothetical protein IHE44_0003507 [Lamprotornis superbus]
MRDRQITLNSDDLGYDSMDGEEEDYDEVLEMDSLEQPAVDVPTLGQSTEISPPAKPFPCSAFPFWGFPSSAKWVWQPPPPVCCQPLPALSSRVCSTAEPCRLPLDEGDCQRYTLRWYYNQRVTECRPFVYSGCQGNLNRFDSKEECELHCGQRPGADSRGGAGSKVGGQPKL